MTEQKAVREMLTQESTWVRFTWNAGAAAGMRWNGNIRQWEHIGKKRKKEEDESDSQPSDDALAAGAAAGMRWNGKRWEHIVEKMEEKVKKGDKKIQHKCLAETKGGKAQGDDRRGGSNKAQEAS